MFVVSTLLLAAVSSQGPPIIPDLGPVRQDRRNGIDGYGAAAGPARGQTLPTVRIVTTLGVIDVEVDSVRAPVTAANFLRYVDGGFYRRGSFHRTVTLQNQPDNPVKIEVVQGAADSTRRPALFPPIGLERTNRTGIAHRAGTISMARGGPDTARDQFFICVTDQPALDFGGARNPDGQGFAAFGRVIQGMDVIRAIQRAPATGQRLAPPITITEAHRLPVPAPRSQGPGRA
ncbi:MAG: peptidylprolyl isomerase [Gemmatimonadales bacterium]